MKRRFCRYAGFSITRIPNMREDPPCFGLPRRPIVPRFIAKEGIFKRDVKIRRIKAHRLTKLSASALRFSRLQQRVGKILTDICAPGRQRRCLAEEPNGRIKIVSALTSKAFVRVEYAGSGSWAEATMAIKTKNAARGIKRSVPE